MAKFSVKAFMQGLAATAAGQLNGEMEGQKELERRQQQEETAMTSILPSLDKPSQDKLLGYLLQRSMNRASGKPIDYTPPSYAEPGGGVFLPSRPLLPASSAAAMQAAAPSVAPGQPPAAGLPINSLLPQATAATLNQMSGFGQNAWQGVPTAPMPQPVPQAPPVSPQAAPMASGAPALPAQGGFLGNLGRAPVPPQGAVAPVAAPNVQAPTAPAAPQRRGVNIPGVGFLAFRGVDPKEAAATNKAHEAALKQLTNAYSTNPEQMAKVQALASNYPTQIETEEQLKQAREITQQLQSASMYAGSTAGRLALADDTQEAKALGADISQIAGLQDPAALAEALPRLWQRGQGLLKRGKVEPPAILLSQRRNLEAMQKAHDAGDTEQEGRIARMVAGELTSPLKPAEKQAKVSTALKLIGSMDPTYVAKHPEVVRQVFEQQGVGYALEGLSGGALNFAGDDIEKRWQQMSRDVSTGKLADANPAVQQQFWDEYTGLAKLTGRQISVNRADLFKLGPVALRKLQRDNALFTWRDKETQRKLTRADLGIVRERLSIEKERLGIEKLQAQKKRGWPSGGKDGGLNANQTVRALQSVRDKALSEYNGFLKAGEIYPDSFDPEHPKDDRERKAAAKWQDYKQARDAVNKFLLRQGVSPDLLQKLGDENAPADAGMGGKKGSDYPAGKAGTGAMINDLAAGKQLQPAQQGAARKAPAQMSDQELKRRLAEKLLGR